MHMSDMKAQVKFKTHQTTAVISNKVNLFKDEIISVSLSKKKNY